MHNSTFVLIAVSCSNHAQAATNGCELAMAVSIVSGGLYECLATEDEFSLLNISILCVHFYFNIYQRNSISF